MIIRKTPIAGVYVLHPERREDDRGWFSRTFCAAELAAAGIDPRVVQINAGYSHRAGTTRGLHLQTGSHAETKIVRCTRGRVWDVAVDLRHGSPTRTTHFGIELSAWNGLALVIPPDCAHGYQTLEDDTEIAYSTTQEYVPAAATGVRWNDPSLAVIWPMEITAISEADRSWPPIEASAGDRSRMAPATRLHNRHTRTGESHGHR